MLVIPQMGEQMIIGRRVEELGAGLYIEKAEVTAEKLREGVRRLLADRRFRERAAASAPILPDCRRRCPSGGRHTGVHPVASIAFQDSSS